jgi:Fic family protein
MTIKGIRKYTGLTQKDFAAQYHIPLQTLKQWESEPGSSSYRRPPDYVIYMLGRLTGAEFEIGNEAGFMRAEGHELLRLERQMLDSRNELPEQLQDHPMTLLRMLREQKDAKVSGQLYELTQIEMAYNSNKIEGSTLTLMQAQMLYTENKTVGSTDYNDIVEMKNHFALFDFMIDTADLPLSHDLIKEYHRILMRGTDRAKLSWFAVGEYKKLDNIIGASTVTTPAKDVHRDMTSLIHSYNSKDKTLANIVDFHAMFEKIHPFQDGNGRVGRIILFKECLANDIVPPVVLDRQKVSYINGLNDYYDHPQKLLRTMEKLQGQYEKQIEKFGFGR